MRDEGGKRSRMRLLMPFSVEKPRLCGRPVDHPRLVEPFGPLGTPLVDAEDAAETLDNLFEGLAGRDLQACRPSSVLPDLRLNGIFAQHAKAVAIGRNLPITITNPFERPMLESEQDGRGLSAEGRSRLAYARNAPAMAKARRQGRGHLQRRPPAARRPPAHGGVPAAGGAAAGRARGARRMVTDRYHAAFAREAVTNLAEIDARAHPHASISTARRSPRSSC